MKSWYLFILAALMLGAISCKKNGGNGITLTIASVSSSIVPVGGSLSVVLNYTDDSQSPIDTVYMQKKRINQDQVMTVRDSLYLSAPSYPGVVKGQLQLDLDNTDFLASAATPPTIGNPPQNESDSLILSFAVKDSDNHTSDTVSTGLIVVMR